MVASASSKTQISAPSIHDDHAGVVPETPCATVRFTSSTYVHSGHIAGMLAEACPAAPGEQPASAVPCGTLTIGSLPPAWPLTVETQPKVCARPNKGFLNSCRDITRMNPFAAVHVPM